MSELFTRTFALDDICIRSGGDGRTVDAYAAVFNVAGKVDNPREGTFNEILAPGSFDKTIAERRDNFTVLFNHGRTIYGTPSERFAMSIGKPLEVRADSKGVFTSTRYNRTQLADEVLAGIDNGDITGQSFTGRFLRSDPMTKGRMRPNRDGTLQTVTRTEVAMVEYGPGIVPVYKEAAIVGVRAEEIAALLTNLDPNLRAELLQIITASNSETSTHPQDAPLSAERSDAASTSDGTSDGIAAAATVMARDWAAFRIAFRERGIRNVPTE